MAVSLKLFLLVVFLGARALAGRKPRREEAPWKSTSCGLFNKTVPLYAHESIEVTSTPQCEPLQTVDMLRGWNRLFYPPLLEEKGWCRRRKTVGGLTVCEDLFAYPPVKQSVPIPGLNPDKSPKARRLSDLAEAQAEGASKECVVWSSLTSSYCDDMGDLAFERYWSQYCRVELFHFLLYTDGRLCERNAKETRKTASEVEAMAAYWQPFTRLTVHRIAVWEKRCYSCLFRQVLALRTKDGTVLPRVDVLKIQSRGVLPAPDEAFAGHTVPDYFNGVEFTILADLYLHVPQWAERVGQVVAELAFTRQSLVDSVGREASNGFNIWAAQRFLHTFAALPREQGGYRITSLTANTSTLLRPTQLSELLASVKINPMKQHFATHTFVRLTARSPPSSSNDSSGSSGSGGKKRRIEVDPALSAILRQEAATAQFTPVGTVDPLDGLKMQLPPFCALPTRRRGLHVKQLEQWARSQLRARCQPERMWLACDRSRDYTPLLPCPQQIFDVLVADYAVSRRWCNFTLAEAAVPTLGGVEGGATAAMKSILAAPWESSFSSSSSSSSSKGGVAGAGSGRGRGLREASAPTSASSSSSFTSTPTDPAEGGADEPAPPPRIAFFFTVYTDVTFLERLLDRLFSPRHVYLVHIDASAPGGVGFYDEVMAMAKKSKFAVEVAAAGGGGKRVRVRSVYLSQHVHIVYGAATATILLSTAMQFFLSVPGWDYFIPVTGSDYPLVPLSRMENMLSSLIEPLPFVMSWENKVSANVAYLQATFPSLYRDDHEVSYAMHVLQRERGYKVMGTTIMELRAANMGPVYGCGGAHGFYRLENRRDADNTQWLFPKHRMSETGRACINESPEGMLPAQVDGRHRVWKKSDPATTAAYDRASVAYIIDTDEGRKYYHFFKHTLLGSEEHYYITMLSNWNRTKHFVNTLASQSVWNTWELGLWEGSLGGFRTHTHFLSPAEFSFLSGFARRGVFFARKFSSAKTPEILDMLDAYIHFNTSTDAGLLWPGYFDQSGFYEGNALNPSTGLYERNAQEAVLESLRSIPDPSQLRGRNSTGRAERMRLPARASWWGAAGKRGPARGRGAMAGTGARAGAGAGAGPGAGGVEAKAAARGVRRQRSRSASAPKA